MFQSILISTLLRLKPYRQDTLLLHKLRTSAYAVQRFRKIFHQGNREPPRFRLSIHRKDASQVFSESSVLRRRISSELSVHRAGKGWSSDSSPPQRLPDPAGPVAKECRGNTPGHPKHRPQAGRSPRIVGQDSQQRELSQTFTAFPFNLTGRNPS